MNTTFDLKGYAYAITEGDDEDGALRTNDIGTVLSTLDTYGSSMKTVRVHTEGRPVLEGSAKGIALTLRAHQHSGNVHIDGEAYSIPVRVREYTLNKVDALTKEVTKYEELKLDLYNLFGDQFYPDEEAFNTVFDRIDDKIRAVHKDLSYHTKQLVDSMMPV